MARPEYVEGPMSSRHRRNLPAAPEVDWARAEDELQDSPPRRIRTDRYSDSNRRGLVVFYPPLPLRIPKISIYAFTFYFVLQDEYACASPSTILNDQTDLYERALPPSLYIYQGGGISWLRGRGFPARDSEEPVPPPINSSSPFRAYLKTYLQDVCSNRGERATESPKGKASEPY
ncbi:hypothetical protein VPNG_09381 [Cytospora leucostoma]|uniref:Uncharacterized protein n=1 Tax=Cytospora leucostoma TaxID=1230097 RepID=A0A423VTF3_9PEZI|nr:hypothetical protein VPNG_09381 [Cytospora leucostoma]